MLLFLSILALMSSFGLVCKISQKRLGKSFLIFRDPYLWHLHVKCYILVITFDLVIRSFWDVLDQFGFSVPPRQSIHREND